MKTLLTGGMPNTGKTKLVDYAANYLVKDKAFNVAVSQDYGVKKILLSIIDSITDEPKDFYVYLTGKKFFGKNNIQKLRSYIL